MTFWEYLRHGTPLAIAHRGGAGEAPQNTMAAFQHAWELGFPCIEIDVRATSDGVLAVYHDPTLDTLTRAVANSPRNQDPRNQDSRNNNPRNNNSRNNSIKPNNPMTVNSGAIADLPWATVRQARVSGLEPIPRLEEVLQAWPDLRVNIDPKHPKAVAPLVKILKSLPCQDRVCVGTFSDRRMRVIRKLLHNSYCTAATPAEIAKLRFESFVGANSRHQNSNFTLENQQSAKPDMSRGCLQVPYKIEGHKLVDKRFLDAAHSRGLQVHVWTINSHDQMQELLDLGVDGILTDYPTLLKGVLESNKQWLPRKPSS